MASLTEAEHPTEGIHYCTLRCRLEAVKLDELRWNQLKSPHILPWLFQQLEAGVCEMSLLELPHSLAALVHVEKEWILGNKIFVLDVVFQNHKEPSQPFELDASMGLPVLENMNEDSEPYTGSLDRFTRIMNRV